MDAEIKVTKSLLGAQHVSYHCPKCGDDLRSPLAEAGKPDTCPNCSARFIIPGAEQLRQLQEQKQAKQQQGREAAEQRQAAKLKEQQEAAAAAASAKKTVEQRNLLPQMSEEDAFAVMGGASVPVASVKPPYSPPALPKKAQPEISEASRRTLQTAAEQAAAAKSGGNGGYSGSKYPFLSALVSLYRIAAVIAFCIGIIAFVAAVKAESVAAVGFGAGAIGAGISAMLFAEVINLFLDMEKNQRESNRLLEQMINRLAANGEPPADKP